MLKPAVIVAIGQSSVEVILWFFYKQWRNIAYPELVFKKKTVAHIFKHLHFFIDSIQRYFWKPGSLKLT